MDEKNILPLPGSYKEGNKEVLGEKQKTNVSISSAKILAGMGLVSNPAINRLPHFIVSGGRYFWVYFSLFKKILRLEFPGFTLLSW